MRKILAILLGALLVAAPANAQMLLLGVGVKPVSGGGGGFTGVGDVASAAAYWSASWAYSSASRSSNLIQACNAADANCVNIPGDATTGILAVSTTNVGGSPCNDSTNICTIKTFYDMTGNGHTMTQATIADRATLLVSCTGLGAGVPCASNNDNAIYIDAITTTRAQPFTVLWVGNRNTATGSDDNVFDSSDSSFKAGYGFFGGANRIVCTAGNDETQAVNDGTWNNLACVFNGASSNMQINSTSNTHSLGTNGPSSANLYWTGGGGGARFIGKLALGAFFASGLSSGTITSISSANQTIGGY